MVKTVYCKLAALEFSIPDYIKSLSSSSELFDYNKLELWSTSTKCDYVRGGTENTVNPQSFSQHDNKLL